MYTYAFTIVLFPRVKTIYGKFNQVKFPSPHSNYTFLNLFTCHFSLTKTSQVNLFTFENHNFSC